MTIASDARPGSLGSAPQTPDQPPTIPGAGAGAARVIGVDVARGAALLGMFAVHIFDTLHSNNTPSLTFWVMGGHALATFVLLAGVSLTFITKRQRTDSRLTDAPTAAALATRALVILLIGLTLNSAVDPEANVILTYYGLMFLLAIPLLRLSSRVLVGISAALVILAPLVVTAAFSLETLEEEPGFSALIHAPVSTSTWFLITGNYPVIAYMAFICVGMVIGRLDLSSCRTALRLALGGAVLAALGWFSSTLILFEFGGLQHLRAAAEPGLPPHETQNIILWEPDAVQSWWWLAERAPYMTTPVRMVHDLGVAMAWLGLCLLMTRLRLLSRLLVPVAAAGAMSLTLYTAHLISLNLDFVGDYTISGYFVMVYVALTFAILWQQTGRRGPLETAVAWISRQARQLVQALQGRTGKASTQRSQNN